MAVGYDKGLAPRSNRQLTAYVRNLLRYYPKPRNRAQIGRDASAFALSQSKPLMDSIIADANARLSSGRAAIGGLTEQLQSRLGPIAAEQHTADEKAKSDSAAQNAALGEFLHAHAASSAADLAQRSSLMGPLPADQQALLDKASTGVGNSAAGAGVARGGVAYDRLNADANTHEAMARELPALAALAGVNAGKQLGAQVNFQTNEAQGKVRAAIPGLVSSYVSNADRGELARAAAALSLAQGAQGQEIQKGIARQSLGLGLARIAQSDTNSRRSASTTKRGQDYTHADRQAAAAKTKSNKANTARQATIKTARNNTQQFAIKLKAGTLGSAGGSSGSLYGSGGGQAAVDDYSEAFHRTAQYLGNQLGRQLALKLGEPWMRAAVNSVLAAAGYQMPSLGNPHTDASTRGN
jgi:hypothetical protein